MAISNAQNQYDEKTKQSKRLGNWRTGLVAGNTATNIAGATISSTNKVSDDFSTLIGACRAAVNELRNEWMTARLNGADTKQLDLARHIIDSCGDYDILDVSKINNRADGAMWSSIVGAATGAGGIITSAIANSDKTRNDNSDHGRTSEKNLNTASNVLAVGATVASGTATVFNATQISAIKRAFEIAEKCSGALR